MQRARHRASRRKTPAQLDREIASVLGTKRHPGRNHAMKASDTWDVAMDALLEQDAPHAAEIVRTIKAEEKNVASMTTAFEKALNKVPAHVRNEFEQQAGVVSKRSYDWSTFADGAAFAFWADAYMSEVDHLEDDETRRALSPRPGGRWDDVLGEPPAAARKIGKQFAKDVRGKITEGELNEVADKFSAKDAGYYGAMQSLGHGVGWGDEGVRARPPRDFDRYDAKLNDAVWRALQRAAREKGVPL